MVALALHGVLDTLRQQAEKTGILVRIDRYWVMTALSVVCVVLGVGLLIVQLIAPGTVVSIFGRLRPIWTALMRILLLLIYVVSYLFFGLFEPVFAGIRDRTQQTDPRPFVSPLNPESLEELASEPLQIPPVFAKIAQTAVILGLVALAVWIFVIAVQKLKRKTFTEGEVIETRETILSLDLVRSQVQGMLNNLRRPRQLPTFVEIEAQEDSRRVIRELYQKLLAQGLVLQLPRSRGQTPNAYQQALFYLCSEEQGALEILTSAYEIARYGREPPTREQMQAAQEAYTRIEAALQAAGPRNQNLF
jgi:hypothetical protein